MTQIGDKTGFLVEFEFEEAALPRSENRHWLFGHLCFWANGQRLGDFESHATLAVAIQLFPDLLANRGRRVDAKLLAAPAEEAFLTIFSALSVDSGQLDDQVQRDQVFYGRFVAVPRGLDVFDGWDAFLIEGERTARLLFRHCEGEIREASLVQGEFDRAIEETLDALRREYDERMADLNDRREP